MVKLHRVGSVVEEKAALPWGISVFFSIPVIKATPSQRPDRRCVDDRAVKLGAGLRDILVIIAVIHRASSTKHP